ncbi:high-affinity iron transporter FtrA, partial [Protomyces lactucae-debilis]
MAQDFFSVPIFFIIFRECLEASIIVSILLAFIDRTATLPGVDTVVQSAQLKKRLVRQVWVGAALGLLLCLIIGGGFLGAFYSLKNDIWAKSENIWEGVFCLIASIFISIMGVAMLKVNKLKAKWTTKLAAMYEEKSNETGRSGFKKFTIKYAMAWLPFITVLREGLEAVIFVGGVGLSTPAKSVPIPVITGLLAGFLVGFALYRSNRFLKIEYFLIASTWLLYLVAAGLFSRSITFFEMNQWNNLTGGDAAENGAGPGSYNIRHTIWHVNFGNPELKDPNNGGWQVFNSIFGWTNTGFYSSVIGYIFYWVTVTVVLVYMRFAE